MVVHEAGFHLFVPPYHTFRPLRGGEALGGDLASRRGWALLWHLAGPPTPAELDVARRRPPGTALVIVLPPAEEMESPGYLLQAVELCRPQSILPHHPHPNPTDLRAVLSRPPEDLPGEVTDYLGWRGIVIDLETRRLIRKTLDLSNDLTTVNGLSRALYLSRRALGRRFTSRGLPVPSHWLHFGRVLRAVMRLQDSEDTLLTTATRLGYPDGFSLSNQMVRLVGIRPVVAREHLGWEWMLEEWLQREAENGGVSREIAARLRERPRFGPERAPQVADPPSTRAAPRRSEILARGKGGASLGRSGPK